MVDPRPITRHTCCCSDGSTKRRGQTVPRNPADLRSYRVSWRLKGQPLKVHRDRRLIVVCLDQAHSRALRELTRPDFVVASCPLQVKPYLDRRSAQTVVLDRCSAKLNCCRRPLSEL